MTKEPIVLREFVVRQGLKTLRVAMTPHIENALMARAVRRRGAYRRRRTSWLCRRCVR